MLARLHCPNRVIGLLRAVLTGHGRTVVTALGIDADASATILKSGSPQGMTASPTAWDIVADFALSLARAAGGDGFRLHTAAGDRRDMSGGETSMGTDAATGLVVGDDRVRHEDEGVSNAFADDLSAQTEQVECCFLRDDGDDATRDELALTVTMLAGGQGFNGVRFSGTQVFTHLVTRSRAACRTPPGRVTPHEARSLHAGWQWRVATIRTAERPASRYSRGHAPVRGPRIF